MTSRGAKSPTRSFEKRPALSAEKVRTGLSPRSQGAERLFVAGLVCGIVKSLDLREPLEAGGVDLGDPVLDGRALNVVFDLAVAKGAFEGYELALLEGLRELREIAPGIDSMPFGASFVIASLVLPAFLGSDVEDNELAIVLSGFGFCVLTEAADEGDFVEHGIRLLFFWFVRFSAVHAGPEDVPSRPTPSATGQILWKGTHTCFGDRSPHLVEARSGIWEGERASEGRGCFERGTLNAEKKG